MLYTVKGLRDGARGVTIRVRVLQKDKTRIVKTKDEIEHKVADVQVGDITGIVAMTLWDDAIDKVSEGDIIDITNGYVNRFKGRLRLNIGKYGVLSKIEDDVFPSVEQIISASRLKKRGVG